MGQKRPWLKVLTICAGIIVLIFGLFHIVQGALFEDAGPESIHLIHIWKFITATILTASIVTLYLIRRHIPRFTEDFIEITSYPARYVYPYSAKAIQWFIGLRWLAFVGSVVILIIGGFVLQLVVEKTCLAPLTLCVLLIGMSNILFSYLASKRIPTNTQIIIQVVSDLVLLTALIHYSGGVENPLFLIYIFHVIIASIILPIKTAYKITSLACILFISVTILELVHVLPHYTLKLFPHEEGVHPHHAAHSTAFTLGISSVFAAVMFITTYFATSVAEGLRLQMKKEREMAAKLVQTAKMAAIGELAGNIAHEVNNPIGIITLKTKTILSDFKDQLPGKVVQDIQKITQHSNRIATIMRGLLTFAVPSIGKKEPVDIQAIIEDSLKLVRSRIETDHIQLKLDLANGPPKIIGDFNEVQQVLINLVNNAVDAMSNGGELTIHTMLSKEPEGIQLEIADTGIGIPAEYLDHIFDPFFTTKGSKGTGLGLAICKGIVKSLGGKIWCESTVAKGSTFYVFLPAPLFPTGPVSGDKTNAA